MQSTAKVCTVRTLKAKMHAQRVATSVVARELAMSSRTCPPKCTPWNTSPQCFSARQPVVDRPTFAGPEHFTVCPALARAANGVPIQPHLVEIDTPIVPRRVSSAEPSDDTTTEYQVSPTRARQTGRSAGMPNPYTECSRKRRSFRRLRRSTLETRTVRRTVTPLLTDVDR